MTDAYTDDLAPLLAKRGPKWCACPVPLVHAGLEEPRCLKCAGRPRRGSRILPEQLGHS